MQKILAICNKHNLALHETKQGALIVELPKANDGYSPLLLTLDGGRTWTPEAAKNNQNSWGGRTELTGEFLAREISEMCYTLGILGLAKIKEIAKDLETAYSENLFH
jgi:hypothetical protein